MNAKHRVRLAVKRLEDRLAPATFFVSASSLSVRDSGGNSAENLDTEIAARMAAGTSKAVLLNAGDSLVFDENDNRVRDPQERVLVSVSAGKGMVFLTDGFGPRDGAFDANEITGLSVSDGFRATINTDVNGSIATTLTAGGVFATNSLQNSSIAGLT